MADYETSEQFVYSVLWKYQLIDPRRSRRDAYDALVDWYDERNVAIPQSVLYIMQRWVDFK